MPTTNIIKYEGDNSTFIWKHPIEDFYTGAQLIVHESQEVIFFLNGQALDLFGPGRHTLETQNLPMLSRMFAKPFGGKTPFHCEVYFINKTEQMALKWGTDSKIEYMEPVYNFPLQIGASGEMSLHAENGRKLLVKLVGTTAGLTQQSLVQRFRGILMSHAKTYLASFIRENSINIFTIDEQLSNMSEALKQRLQPDFADYGMSLDRFYITTIVKPENDSMYQRFRELHFRQYADVAEAQLRQQVGMIEQQTQMQRMVIEAQGIAQKRALEGYTYQQERSFEVAERIAANEAIGQMSNLGIGLGMMGGIGSTVSSIVGNTIGNIGYQPDKLQCPYCQTELLSGSKFCFNCGSKIQSSESTDAVCSKCGEVTPEGKFCIHCGSLLQLSCSGCGKEVPLHSKFCPGCGQKL